MNNNENKKRRSTTGFENDNKQQSKRSRNNEQITNQDSDDDGVDDDQLNDIILPTITEMLEVPIELIFREVSTSTHQQGPVKNDDNSMQSNSNTRKPLLSKTEAQCFMKINLLAHEIDNLTSISTTILQQHIHASTFAAQISNNNITTSNPYLRPIITILNILQQHDNNILQQISNELNRIVYEFKIVSSTLRQCSEQNWNAASIMAGNYILNHLVEEKQKVSDLQEELCQRIEIIINNNNNSSNQSSTITHQKMTTPLVPLKEYCVQTFGLTIQDDDESQCNDTSRQEMHNKIMLTQINDKSCDADDHLQNDDDNDEQEKGFHSLTAVTTPAESPEPPNLTSPDAIDNTEASRIASARNAAAQSLSAFSTYKRRSATQATPGASSASAQPTSSCTVATTRQHQLANTDSSNRSKIPSTLDQTNNIEFKNPNYQEKENEPSQSSSQHSSSSRLGTPMDPVTAATTTTSESQDAAHVLSSLAAGKMDTSTSFNLYSSSPKRRR